MSKPKRIRLSDFRGIRVDDAWKQYIDSMGFNGLDIACYISDGVSIWPCGATMDVKENSGVEYCQCDTCEKVRDTHINIMTNLEKAERAALREPEEIDDVIRVHGECVFCHSLNLSIYQGSFNPKFYVLCDDCNASGPPAMTIEKAVKLWNQSGCPASL